MNAKHSPHSEAASFIICETYGGVAQLGEHLPCKQGVMGSNPIISTTGRGFGAINRLNLTKLSGRERTTKMNEGESRVRGRPR